MKPATDLRKIFINYRRDDTRADSGRIYDRLLTRFPGQVFRDVGSLEPGVEWPEAINRVLSQVQACIVVIGKEWLNIQDAAGGRRLDKPDDTVRQEIATALKHNARIFPVLVGGAKMPDEQDVPEELRPICRRNALEITEQDWDECCAKLIRALETALGLPPVSVVTAKTKSPWKWIAAGVVGVLVLLGIIGVSVGDKKAASNPAQYSAPAPVISDTQVPNRPAADDAEKDAATAPSEPAVKQLVQADAVGTWQAFISGQGQQFNESIEVYRDHSFRSVMQGTSATVGRWKIDQSAGRLDLINGTNFLANNNKFSCALTPEPGNEEALTGTCINRQQMSWSISMNRSSKAIPDRVIQLPRVDLSDLTVAERTAFAQWISTQRCTCPCGMNIYMCLEKDQTCPYSPGLARNLLTQFLATVHSE